jgi:hypothetical protein
MYDLCYVYDFWTDHMSKSRSRVSRPSHDAPFLSIKLRLAATSGNNRKQRSSSRGCQPRSRKPYHTYHPLTTSSPSLPQHLLALVARVSSPHTFRCTRAKSRLGLVTHPHDSPESAASSRRLGPALLHKTPDIILGGASSALHLSTTTHHLQDHVRV